MAGESKALDVDLSPPKVTSRGDLPSSFSPFEIKLGKAAFSGLTPTQVKEALKGRTVLLLVLSDTRGVLLGSKPEVLDNAYFRQSVLDVDPSELKPYNLFNLIIQEPKQLTVILRDDVDSLTAFTALSFNDIYGLKIKVLIALQKLDKFQSFNVMGKDLRWLMSSWIQSIIDTNRIFWKQLRDKFPELFSIRRFRLEIHDFKESKVSEGEIRRFMESVGSSERKLMSEKESYLEKNEVSLDDYTQLSLQDKKYADAYDEKFKTKATATDEYESDITKEELLFIANWLLRMDEKALLLKLWSALATSFDYYQLALYTPFHKLVNAIDNYNIMGEYSRHLVYMMYKEESNIRHESKVGQRHIVSLRHLQDLDLLVPPDVFTMPSAASLLPLPKSNEIIHRGIIGWHGAHGRMGEINRYANYLCKFRSIEEYKSRLSQISQGTLVDIKIPGVYITGGLSALCLIRTTKEATEIVNVCDKGSPTETSGTLREIALDLLDKKPYYCANFEQEKDNAFEYMLTSPVNFDADIDVAIFAEDGKEFKQKLDALEAHIATRLPKLPMAPSQGEQKRILPKFEHFKGDRYRLTLPNRRNIEAFFMNTTTKKASPLAMIFDFHVPPVRHYYDPILDDVIMLPSCLWAGWTSTCLDIKYFGSSKSPIEIIFKYMLRGYRFILNNFEANVIEQFALSPSSKGLEAREQKQLRDNFMDIFRDTIRRERKVMTKYVSESLWLPTKRNGKQIHTNIAPFEYPNDPYDKVTKAEAGEDPEVSEDHSGDGDGKVPKWFRRKLRPLEADDLHKLVYVQQNGVVIDTLSKMNAIRKYPHERIVRERVGFGFSGQERLVINLPPVFPLHYQLPPLPLPGPGTPVWQQQFLAPLPAPVFQQQQFMPLPAPLNQSAQLPLSWYPSQQFQSSSFPSTFQTIPPPPAPQQVGLPPFTTPEDDIYVLSPSGTVMGAYKRGLLPSSFGTITWNPTIGRWESIIR